MAYSPLEELEKLTRPMNVAAVGRVFGCSRWKVREMVNAGALSPIVFPGLTQLKFSPRVVAKVYRQHNPGEARILQQAGK